MPKMKTKKALKKRIILNAGGKWRRKSAFTSHLALNKSTKQKRHLRKSTSVNPTDYKRLKELLPS